MLGLELVAELLCEAWRPRVRGQDLGLVVSEQLPHLLLGVDLGAVDDHELEAGQHQKPNVVGLTLLLLLGSGEDKSFLALLLEVENEKSLFEDSAQNGENSLQY